jgi:hypothetical protein
MSAALEHYRALGPLRYPMLERFEVAQLTENDRRLAVTVVMRERGATDGDRLRLVFRGVRDLTIDWPRMNPVSLDLIEIEDISDRGWEDLRFRVAESAAAFAFWCESFEAELVG